LLIAVAFVATEHSGGLTPETLDRYEAHLRLRSFQHEDRKEPVVDLDFADGAWARRSRTARSSLVAEGVEASEPERVRDDENARKRHRPACYQRIQESGSCERKCSDVVGERPKKVALAPPSDGLSQ